MSGCVCSLGMSLVLAASLATKAVAADAAMPAPPKVSTFAPAEDLVRQADQYLKALATSVAAEDTYKDDQEKIAKDSNTLAIVALALGLHDEESKYKTQAGAMVTAARAVAATKDYAAAKKAVAALEETANGKSGDAAELKWSPVASLPELMKQVPLVNTKLKRYVKASHFKKKAKDTAGYTAVIAAIAQGAMADLSEATKPGQAKQWYAFSAAMRDDAAAVNAAIHRRDEAAVAKAMKKLQQGCDDCHAVFHPGATEKTSGEE